MSMTDLFFRYIPLAGSASALAFSLNVMNPTFFRSVFAPNELLVANSLWFNAHLGIGLYLYGRKHMRQGTTYQRVLFSVFGTVLFNFGSVLFWATTRALVLKNDILRSLFGVGTGIAMLFIGKEYLDFIDGNLSKELD